MTKRKRWLYLLHSRSFDLSLAVNSVLLVDWLTKLDGNIKTLLKHWRPNAKLRAKPSTKRNLLLTKLH